MNKKISVEDALKRGINMIIYPSLILMLVLFCLFFLFCLPYKNTDIIWLLLTFVPILIPAIYYLVVTPKWLVWAFENVRNVHELKKLAIYHQLIYKDESFWNKLLIWSGEDKEKWNKLQSKFLIEDEPYFEYDFSIPFEVNIKLEKSSVYLNLFFSALMLIIGFYKLYNENYWSGGFFIILCIFTISQNYKSVLDNKVYIKINNFGIQSINTPFYSWSEVSNENIYFNKQSPYLYFEHPNGVERLYIKDLSNSYSEIMKFLRVYRTRYQQNHNLKN
ncbi:MAG: hypothetical protein SFU91_15005 [Chloroherpetonaceae bacterium]|nr:hypothetical protein [Chloroherpetonaceae bacterium]